MIYYLVCLLCLPCNLHDVLQDAWPGGGVSLWSYLCFDPSLSPRKCAVCLFLSQAVDSAHSAHWGTGSSPPPPNNYMVTPLQTFCENFQCRVRFLSLVTFSTWSNENILKFLLQQGQAVLSQRLQIPFYSPDRLLRRGASVPCPGGEE